jgi:DNA-binding MarR family transcriptional regulator
MKRNESAGPPLARLLAVGYRSLIDGLHEQLRAKGWDDVRPAFGFVLLAARDAPTTVRDVAVLMGTTKQAASKLLDAMEDAGYVRRGVDRTDGRQRPVTLTKLGARLLRQVEDIYTTLEAAWAELIGEASVERLRRDLTKVLSGPDGQLPVVRPPT